MNKKYIRSSILSALWLILLTFPIMVIKINTTAATVRWRWGNLIYVGVGGFLFTLVWNFFLDRRNRGGFKAAGGERAESAANRMGGALGSLLGRILRGKTDAASAEKVSLKAIFAHKPVRFSSLGGLVLLAALFPFLVSFYQVGIVTSALMFVILGLGLNIVIGYGGLLHLGYAAFYAVGAYNYGLLYLHWGWPFWAALPLGAVSGVLFGLLIGIPVLRLRGDYLAIVTLAFGEIMRLLLENLTNLTKGPEGIAQIPRPGFFVELSLQNSARYLYFIAILMVVLTIFVIRRLEDSRIGRALEAMREDEIAAQAMGIDITRTKLITFALGALWAGFAGVVLAGKTTYINPGSFTLMESVMILVAVVLGGTGSIPGVCLGALLVTLIPEYFRALSDYRMLVFGAALVIMSIFRPQGIIPRIRKRYSVGEQL
ncbi:MAG: branched-chain amino acid ABC transporter permease [Spirochaeta sp. LUC14_002_19_P3]|nr:MAG: branched-chain amino acid ABC transporter permease [Spirochaeta sp. LUC14_002_19_P3]